MVLGLGPGGEHAARKLAEAGLERRRRRRGAGRRRVPVLGLHALQADGPAGRPARRGAPRRPAGRRRRRSGPDWSLVAARIREANHDWTDHQHVEPLERAGGPDRARARPAGRARAWSRSSATAAPPSCVPARGVLLNTGTAPLRLPIDGLAETPYWTNREAMKVTEVPRRLVVVGGGPNGLELAQVFARYGAEVTLLEVGGPDRGPRGARGEPGAGRGAARRGDRRPRRRRRGAGRPRRRVPPAGRRRDAHRRPAAGRRRPQHQPRRRRPRDRRARPGGRHRRDRRADARRRAALGGRRHHRQGRVHPRLALPGRRSRCATSSARTGRRPTTARSPGSPSPTPSSPSVGPDRAAGPRRRG